MSTIKPLATNPFDFRRVCGGDFEVYDTRDGRVLRVCVPGSTAAEDEANRLWHAELTAQADAADAAAEAGATWLDEAGQVMTAQIAADQAADAAGDIFDYAQAIARANADRQPPAWATAGATLRHTHALDHARVVARAEGRPVLALSFSLRGRRAAVR